VRRALDEIDAVAPPPGFTLCGAEVFVMPGPYEKSEVAAESLSELRAWVKRHAPPKGH
jgi:hypothetical protein